MKIVLIAEGLMLLAVSANIAFRSVCGGYSGLGRHVMPVGMVLMTAIMVLVVLLPTVGGG